MRVKKIHITRNISIKKHTFFHFVTNSTFSIWHTFFFQLRTFVRDYRIVLRHDNSTSPDKKNTFSREHLNTHTMSEMTSFSHSIHLSTFRVVASVTERKSVCNEKKPKTRKRHMTHATNTFSFREKKYGKIENKTRKKRYVLFRIMSWKFPRVWCNSSHDVPEWFSIR